MNDKNNFKRMCSFYVSEIHLSIMILPYISKKIEKGELLTTFLEKDMQKEMELLITEINIRKNLKDIIKNTKWTKTDNISYENIEKIINKNKGINNILVVGTKQYINNVNKNIEEYLKKYKNKVINEIDAYKLEKNKINFNNILNQYKYVLNTSGEFLVEDMFEKKIYNT